MILLNVLYLINHAGSGGTERYLLDLAEHYPHGGAYLIYNEPGRLSDRMAELGMGTLRVVMRGPFDIASAAKVARFCRDSRIDIIHTQFMRETYVALLAKIILRNEIKIKIVYTCHIDMNNNPAWKLTNALLGKKIDSYVAVCGSVRRTMIKNYFPAEKIQIIYNGVDAEPEPAKKNLRDAFGIGPDAFVFATLTRFTSEKGTAFLLAAIKRLKELTEAPFKVLIAGEGPLYAESERLAAEYGISGEALFLGYRTDTGDVLSTASVYLNASKSECLSVAILEAMSRGLPVVATDAGGNAEIVNGETACGFTVRYGDADAYARKMLAFITDAVLTAKAGENAKRAVADKFNAIDQRALTYAVYAGGTD